MNHVAPRGAPQIVRSQAPAAREAKRPNGHKVQLALRRDIDDLHAQLERQQKATDSASKRIYELENQLLALGADRDGWRAHCERNAKFIGELERILRRPSRQKSWEERREQLAQAIAALQARQATTEAAVPAARPGGVPLACCR